MSGREGKTFLTDNSLSKGALEVDSGALWLVKRLEQTAKAEKIKEGEFYGTKQDKGGLYHHD